MLYYRISSLLRLTIRLVNEHLTPRVYVDIAINELTLVKNNQDNDFNKYNLTKISSFTLKTQAVKDNEVITKDSVDQFHNDNDRNRRDLRLHFYDESTDLVKINQDNDPNDKK